MKSRKVQQICPNLKPNKSTDRKCDKNFLDCDVGGIKLHKYTILLQNLKFHAFVRPTFSHTPL